MTRESATLMVSHRVLEWARRTYGYTVSEASKVSGINEASLSKWESEDSQISLSAIRKLSKLYKRSFEVLLLPAPPQERADPKYRISEQQPAEETRETKLIIREAKWIQDIAEELKEKAEDKTKAKVQRYDSSSAAEKAAQEERRKFGIEISTQMKWRDDKEALREWVKAVESKGILIFQVSMPVGVRGFSIPEKDPPVITLNTIDTPNSRIFTLFHEYAHILLGESGICDPSNLHVLESTKRKSIENWCNDFAAAFMMPANDVKSLATRIGTSQSSISKMCRDLKASTEALLIRLYELNVIEYGFFKQEVELAHKRSITYQKEQVEKRKRLREKMKKEGKELKIDVVGRARRIRGTNFIRLVLYNRSKGTITTKDAMDYLSVGPENLDKLQTSV